MNTFKNTKDRSSWNKIHAEKAREKGPNEQWAGYGNLDL
jgi:hypothetical protein